MGLKYYKNKLTGEVRKSLKKLDLNIYEEILMPPNPKFMEKADSDKNVSRVKNQTKELTSRSRNYSRDVELDDNIQFNKTNGLDKAVSQSFLNSKGQRRRKIDDI